MRDLFSLLDKEAVSSEGAPVHYPVAVKTRNVAHARSSVDTSLLPSFPPGQRAAESPVKYGVRCYPCSIRMAKDATEDAQAAGRPSWIRVLSIWPRWRSM